MLYMPGLVSHAHPNMAMLEIILDVYRKEIRIMKKRRMNLNRLRIANPGMIIRVTMQKMIMIHITTQKDTNKI